MSGGLQVDLRGSSGPIGGRRGKSHLGWDSAMDVAVRTKAFLVTVKQAAKKRVASLIMAETAYMAERV